MKTNRGSSSRFAAVSLIIAFVALSGAVWLWLQQSWIPVIEATSRPGYQHEAEYKAFTPADFDTEVHVPFVNSDPTWDWETTVVVQNTSTSPVSVTLHYHDLTGAETQTVNDTLPASGVRSYSPSGVFQGSLVIDANQPIVAMVNEKSLDDGWTGDGLMSYQGAAASIATNDIILLPIYRQFSEMSSFFAVQNIGAVADVNVRFFDMSGSFVYSQTDTLPADSAHWYNVDDIAALGTNYAGLALIQGENPVAGIYHVIDGSTGGAVAYEGPPVTGGGLNYDLTGSYKGDLDDDIARQYLPQVTNSSTILLYNVESTSTEYVVSLYPPSQSSNNSVYATTGQIAAGNVSIIRVDLNMTPPVPDDFQGSAVIESTGPLGAWVNTTWQSEFPTTATGYGAVDATEVTTSALVPYVRKSADNTVTAISVQSAGADADNVTVTYYYEDGSTAGTEIVPIKANRANTFDQATSTLPTPFRGSAVVTSDEPIAVTGFISHQAPRCVPPSDIHIQHTPAGDVFNGDKLLFTVSASGDIPFSYSWTLDGLRAGDNQSTFSHSFDTPGVHTAGVTVTNECRQDVGMLEVTVQQRAAQMPDLSTSIKTVNLSSVDSGDMLKYTLILRNSSALNATVIVTDAIPSHTSYVVNSAWASDGTTVAISDGKLHWSGQVLPETPLLIYFSAEVVAGLEVGASITNVAQLDDALGNVRLLQARSVYNPGYKLSINDGVLYTNDADVSLRYSWDATDDINHVKFSNDGGFGPAGDATEWLVVDPNDPTYGNWFLSTYGDHLLPRTVYARFRNTAGIQFGPVQDDIIFDPEAPTINRIEIIFVNSLQFPVVEDVIVRVTSSDGNSGVNAVQLSHSANFDDFSEYSALSNPTNINWMLQPSGKVYVRVKDRAGNLSEITDESGSTVNNLYLPAFVRLGDTQ